MRGRTTLLAFSLLVSFVDAACQPAGTPRATAIPTQVLGGATFAPGGFGHVELPQVAFDYPLGWTSRTGSLNPSGQEAIVFVGSGDLASDCVTAADGSGTCFPWPQSLLSDGGIDVAFRVFGMPGSTPPPGGTSTSVDGHRARTISGPASDACRAIRGDESIEVVLEPPAAAPGWTALEACLAGPDRRAAEAAFSQIVGSVRLP